MFGALDFMAETWTLRKVESIRRVSKCSDGRKLRIIWSEKVTNEEF